MERLMKVSEVASVCQVHPKTVRRAIARGELRAARLGTSGALRVSEDDVTAWIDARCTPPRPAPPVRRGWLVA